MKRQFSMLLVACVALCGLHAAAQQAQPVPARGATAQAKPATPVVAEVRPANDDRAGGQPVNIRIEVTIVDQAPTGMPVRKVITILAADRSFARIRSLFADTPDKPSVDNRRVDVDASPRIVGNSIRVELTIQNNALGTGNPLLNWTQSLTVFLENGKVATPIESTDPSTNRKMSIEVKATILK